MYYDTLQEAIDAAPDCTHVLTTGPEWDMRRELEGKFQPVRSKSGGSYYDCLGGRIFMRDDGWIVAWTRGDGMSRTEAAYKVVNGEYPSDSLGFYRPDKDGMYSFDGHKFKDEEIGKYRQLVNDGYTLWLDGGECPVDEDVIVDVVTRGRGKFISEAAGDLRWSHKSESDIIAYRVVSEEAKDNGTFGKVAHYTDETGTDLIDDFARYRTKEQFRGAMMFVLEKYMRRLGKKDDVFEEVEKIAKYSNRWLEYERKLK